MRPRFVIADDSAYSRDLIRLRLELLGCDVIGEVENALDAMMLCRELLPEAIAIDLAMPAVGAFGAIEAVRQIRQELPTVAIFSESDAVAQALEEEPVGIATVPMRKPIGVGSFDLIRDRLRSLLTASEKLDQDSSPHN